jgi:hypothetical protein
MKKLKFVLLVFISVLFVQNYCAYGYFTDNAYSLGDFFDFEGGWYEMTSTTIDRVKVTALAGIFSNGDPTTNTWAKAYAILKEGGTTVDQLRAERLVPGYTPDEWNKPAGHPGCDEVYYFLHSQAESKQYELEMPGGDEQTVWAHSWATAIVYIWE